MPRTTALNLAGRRFGRLVAYEPTDRRASNGAVIWRCVCDCKAVAYVISTNLTTGNTVSCGCHHRRIAPAAGRKGGVESGRVRARKARRRQARRKG